jgi:hypothetical protein
MTSKHATAATGTDAGTGDIHKAQWNEAHVPIEPRQSQQATTAGGTTSSVTLPRTPLTTSVFFLCSVHVVSTVQSISSISQTNVTWTSVHTAANGTANKVELWKGVGNGSTPGTGITVTYGGTITNVHINAIEFPGGYLASTPALDQSADATGTGTTQTTGTIVPTSNNNVTFALMCVANGSTEIVIKSPFGFIQLTGINGLGYFGGFAYKVGSIASLFAACQNQSSATWANTIVSVI